MCSRSRSLQALGLFAGTKPSKVAARLSLADWLLVVLLGTGTSVSSSTDAITAATVALVRAFIIGDMVARLILWACSSFGWWSRLHFWTFFLPSSFRRPCFQRGEAWEKSQITVRPSVPPKNLRNKWRFELAKHMYRIGGPLGFGTSKAKAQPKILKHNMCLVGGNLTHEKRRRRTKFCSHDWLVC